MVATKMKAPCVLFFSRHYILLGHILLTVSQSTAMVPNKQTTNKVDSTFTRILEGGVKDVSVPEALKRQRVL
jgi:hypothetical protein